MACTYLRTGKTLLQSVRLPFLPYPHSIYSHKTVAKALPACKQLFKSMKIETNFVDVCELRISARQLPKSTGFRREVGPLCYQYRK
jgi:hypothetical protein